MGTKNTNTIEDVAEAVPVEEGDSLPIVAHQHTIAASSLSDAEKAALVKFLEHMSVLGDLDPEEAALEIIGRVLGAQTVEQVLAEPRIVGARTMLGVPIELHSVRFNRSDFEGTGAYSLLEVIDLTNGEPTLITCGAHQVMAQAYKLQELGGLPAVVQLVETAKATKAGFRPMFLRIAQRPPALNA